ncbi:MAG: hypothetical protein ACYTG0_21650 [Planctomycetota bacterium]
MGYLDVADTLTEVGNRLLQVCLAVQDRYVVFVVRRILAVAVLVPADDHHRIRRELKVVPLVVARHAAFLEHQLFGCIDRVLNCLVWLFRRAVAGGAAGFGIDVDQILGDAVAIDVFRFAIVDKPVGLLADTAVVVQVESAWAGRVTLALRKAGPGENVPSEHRLFAGSGSWFCLLGNNLAGQTECKHQTSDYDGESSVHGKLL